MVGFDDDLAGEATRVANRLHGLLTQIHPSLEQVLGPRLQHPAVLTLLERFGSPAQIRKAGRRRLVTLLRPKAPRMAERLVEDIFTALDEQTVVVPGTEAAALIVPSLAGSVAAALDQRKLLAGRIEELLEAHPLSKVLSSMPGIGVRTGARILIEVSDGSTFPTAGHLPAYAGLAPATRSSGSSIRGEQPSRRGNKQLKRAFLLSTFAALGDPASRAYYDKKISQGKHHTQALLCLARRRADVLFACSATAPSTNRGRWPRSRDQRLSQEDDPVGLDIEAEHRTFVAALGIHEDRLAQASSDLPEEPAEHIESFLALQFSQVNVEIDDFDVKETEDRQHLGGRPDPQVRALSVRRTGQHALRPGHRQHRFAFGVLALPTLRFDEIEDRLPVLNRGIGDTQVRQRSHQVWVEEAPHVIPQQISHTAMLPVSPTQRSLVSLDQRDGGTPRIRFVAFNLSCSPHPRVADAGPMPDPTAIVRHRACCLRTTPAVLVVLHASCGAALS